MIKNVLMQEKVIKTAAKCAPENFLKKKAFRTYAESTYSQVISLSLHSWNIILV